MAHWVVTGMLLMTPGDQYLLSFESFSCKVDQRLDPSLGEVNKIPLRTA